MEDLFHGTIAPSRSRFTSSPDNHTQIVIVIVLVLMQQQKRIWLQFTNKQTHTQHTTHCFLCSLLTHNSKQFAFTKVHIQTSKPIDHNSQKGSDPAN
mmetsp:Transcript_14278/g.34463  ORF Transcript_14278/g.34463 Transcript_14278/m.34463 type:complete len:97 (+) Transcript_14278:49-339(+)